MSAQLWEQHAEGPDKTSRRGRALAGAVAMLANAALLLLLGACVPEVASDQPAPQPPSPAPVAALAEDPGERFFAIEGPVAPGYLHCSKCHEPIGDELEASMPHPSDHREQCLLCHSTRSIQPFDESHNAIFNQTCQLCHMPAMIQ